jgi:metacaspase-1
MLRYIWSNTEDGEHSHKKMKSRIINATFYQLSGSLDTQTSDDVFDVSEFELPNPAGKAGGALTSIFLNTMYTTNDTSMVSWHNLLKEIRSKLRALNYPQIPQLSSSVAIDGRESVKFRSSSSSGTNRAVLVGINYVGQRGELFGCHNDVRNMKRYLMEVHKYVESNITVLMDDGRSESPTRRNIENAFTNICNIARSGDCVCIHYAGHGELVKDRSGDEKSGSDSTILPVDFRQSGRITDDDIFNRLVKPMPLNVHVIVITDCCHSGTVLDLPFKFLAVRSNDQK